MSIGSQTTGLIFVSDDSLGPFGRFVNKAELRELGHFYHHSLVTTGESIVAILFDKLVALSGRFVALSPESIALQGFRYPVPGNGVLWPAQQTHKLDYEG